MAKFKKTCAVAICKSPNEASYHRFPKEKTLQKLWLDCCKRDDKISVESARICSNHFKPDDYERDLRNELLNIPVRKILKQNAVPSLDLLPSHGTIGSGEQGQKRKAEDEERQERLSKRARKQLVLFLT